MRLRTGAVLAAGVSVAGFLLPASAASATTLAVTCGQVITHSTTLRADLTCSGVALTLSGFLTLDLNGHTVTGDIATSVAAHSSSYRIAGGTVTGNVKDVGDASGVTQADEVLHNLTVHGDVTHTGRTTVTASTITGRVASTSPTGPGNLDVAVTDSTVAGGISTFGNVVVDNSTTGFIREINRGVTVQHSTVAGIFADETSVQVSNSFVGDRGVTTTKSFGVTLANDTVRGAKTGLDTSGATYQSSTKAVTVTGTVFVHDGVGMKLVADLAAPSTKISGNTFVGNAGVGLLIEPEQSGDVSGSTISHNLFQGNGGDGLQISASSLSPGFTVGDNLAVGNHGYGINAPGVVDGGGNIASGNTNPAQCLGVVCVP